MQLCWEVPLCGQSWASHNPILCVTSFEIQGLFPKGPNQASMFATNSLNTNWQHHIQHKTQQSQPLSFNIIVGKNWSCIFIKILDMKWEICITCLPNFQSISPHSLFSKQGILTVWETGSLDEGGVICWLSQNLLLKLNQFCTKETQTRRPNSENKK